MDEAKLALEITKGIKGFFQDFVAPDMKAIIAVLNQHTELLKEHSQKLDKLTESALESRVALKEHGRKLDKLDDSIHQLRVGQAEILARLDLEKRVSALEKVIAEIKG